MSHFLSGSNEKNEYIEPCPKKYSFVVLPVIFLPISFRVTSLAQGQSNDCPCASEVTLKDIGKMNQYQTTTKYKSVPLRWTAQSPCSTGVILGHCPAEGFYA